MRMRRGDSERFWKDGEIEQLSPSGFARADFRFLTSPPDSPGQRPFFLGLMRVFGESYLPLKGAIRTCFLVPEYGIYTYLYIGDPMASFVGDWFWRMDDCFTKNLDMVLYWCPEGHGNTPEVVGSAGCSRRNVSTCSGVP